ncbi:MAG TPA: outer membrane beta-barrel protein [Thermoanaerobaculia bacterium]|nr:outer membrane beta-barrel protein [Thermoanaerobaculia bacterium]
MSRRLCVILTLGWCVAAAPAWAQGWYGADHNLRLRVGGFEPEGDSEYWRDKEADFTGEASDLQDVSVGLEYRVDLTRNFGLLFAGSLYEGETGQRYLDFEDEAGDDIRHITRLEIASATVGGVFHFAGPEAAIRPYVGAGGGIYSWRLEEDGDFIDFTPPPPVIFDALLESSGTAFGYYLQGGFEVPIGRRWAFFAEGRWQRVEDDLEDDFEDDFGKIDLSGSDLGAGLSVRF